MWWCVCSWSFFIFSFKCLALLWEFIWWVSAKLTHHVCDDCPPATREQYPKNIQYFIPGSDLLGVLLFLVPRPENVFCFKKTKDFNIFAVVKYIFNTIWVIVLCRFLSNHKRRRKKSCFGLAVASYWLNSWLFVV